MIFSRRVAPRPFWLRSACFRRWPQLKHRWTASVQIASWQVARTRSRSKVSSLEVCEQSRRSQPEAHHRGFLPGLPLRRLTWSTRRVHEPESPCGGLCDGRSEPIITIEAPPGLMPLLFESRRMSTMPKKIDEEFKARVVRRVNDHVGDGCVGCGRQAGRRRRGVGATPALRTRHLRTRHQPALDPTTKGWLTVREPDEWIGSGVWLTCGGHDATFVCLAEVDTFERL